MTLVYSNEKIEGLDGAYRNPAFFDGIEDGAEVVYTDSDVIAKAYKDAGIEVKTIEKEEEEDKKKQAKRGRK